MCLLLSTACQYASRHTVKLLMMPASSHICNAVVPTSTGAKSVDLDMQIQKSSGVKYMPGVGPTVPQQCPETGANFLMGGPFWADPIHNMDWVHGILKSVQVVPGPYIPSPLPPSLLSAVTGSYTCSCDVYWARASDVVHPTGFAMMPRLVRLAQTQRTQLSTAPRGICIPNWRRTVQCSLASTADSSSQSVGQRRGEGHQGWHQN